jgi:hypothetical protein
LPGLNSWTHYKRMYNAFAGWSAFMRKRIVVYVLTGALCSVASTATAGINRRMAASSRLMLGVQARAAQSRRTEEAPGKALLCADLIGEWQGTVSRALGETPPSGERVKAALDYAGNLVDIANLLDVSFNPDPIAVTNQIAKDPTSTTQNTVKAVAGRWMLQLKLPFMTDRLMLSSAAVGDHLSAVSNLIQAVASDGKPSTEKTKEVLDMLDRLSGDVQSLPIRDRKPALQYVTEIKDGLARMTEGTASGSNEARSALHSTLQRTENEILKQLAQIDAEQPEAGAAAARSGAPGAAANASRGSDLDEALRNAAAGGSFFEMMDLIQRGANVNAGDPDTGETPLMWATEGGNPAKVSGLLTRHANVNAADTLGETALMKAVSEGRADLVQTLIAAGASINAKAKDGTTALMIAATHDAADIVKILLAKKADTGAKDSSGRTALQLAQQEGSKAAANLLKSAGAR